MFNFLYNCHVFHSGCTILHFHQQYTMIPIFPHCHQHLYFLLSFHNGCEVIFHGFHLHLPNDFWCWAYFHVFMGHLSIFFWRNVYSKSFPIFKQVVLFYFHVELWSSLYILNINPFPGLRFSNIFSHSLGCLFTLWVMSSDAPKVFSYWCSLIYLFLPVVWCYIQEITAKYNVMKMLPYVFI